MIISVKVVTGGEHCCKQSQILVYIKYTQISHSLPPLTHFLTHTHSSYSGTVGLKQYQFHLLMHHVCLKIHENRTITHLSVLPTGLSVEVAGTLPHCIDRTVSLAASAFERSHVSLDINWLRLNEVIFRYCVTCLECPFCNSCMRCVADCSPKLTTYSLRRDGWYAVKDRHGPTGGGMKGVEGWCRAPRVRMYVLIARMHMWCGEKSTHVV